VSDFFNMRPAPDRLVRDPGTQVSLPKTGARKPDNRYWRRRLASGDVFAGPADKGRYITHLDQAGAPVLSAPAESNEVTHG
jgi:hypothetical protein